MFQTVLLPTLIETIVDSLKMLPFLLAAYFLIEWLEHRASERITARLRSAGRYGCIAGAVLGCVPQCGFSVAAVKLYNAGVITLGTLFAVLLSTSDEALPVLFANPGSIGAVWRLILCKVVIALAAGFAADLLLGARRYSHEADADRPEHHHSDVCHCHCDSDDLVKRVLVNTAKTFAFIFAVSLTLNLVIAFVGEQNLSAMLLGDTIWQPFLCALLGFIPNCAPSVILTQLYVEGGISFGAALAGLCTGAGVGLAVLYRDRDVKRTLAICAALYSIGAVSGVVVDLLF